MTAATANSMYFNFTA